jgi:putative transposase
MAIPTRNSDPTQIEVSLRTFFLTTSAWQSRNLLQSHRMAGLLADVLQHYRTEHKFILHEFVIMPNHLHVLISLTKEISVEKAAQFIKGGFSFRAKREIGFTWPIWQRGFSEIRIFSLEAFTARRNYVHENPVRARLVQSAAEWEYGSASGHYEVDPCPEYLRG